MLNLERHDKGFRLDPVNNIDNSLKYFLNQSLHFRMINFYVCTVYPRPKHPVQKQSVQSALLFCPNEAPQLSGLIFLPFFPPINETDKQGG